VGIEGRQCIMNMPGVHFPGRELGERMGVT